MSHQHSSATHHRSTSILSAEKSSVAPRWFASLLGFWYFGTSAPNHPKIVATMQPAPDRLPVRTSGGGEARYEDDDYHHRVSQDVANVPRDPWFIRAWGGSPSPAAAPTSLPLATSFSRVLAAPYRKGSILTPPTSAP
jgi:hypothetical protein